ncbi:hypothetical protein GGD63_000481 [Bradyrhizobium sp. cir1]|uniref:hypothetical protein n=1 Tax=Bradyrhizobium sp. cir1 TaxID=1445730 RepID=UPI0016059941|nr:hypothetical protein [Bradyrhizobium sp. cir1]MBB4367712.1 hypothetical protein [Bradyrhizobium sp. cir1]
MDWQVSVVWLALRETDQRQPALVLADEYRVWFYFMPGLYGGAAEPMPRLPSPDPVRPGSERRLRDLQQRFRAVSERRGEATSLRQGLRAATASNKASREGLTKLRPAGFTLASVSMPRDIRRKELVSQVSLDVLGLTLALGGQLKHALGDLYGGPLMLKGECRAGENFV